MWFLEALPEEQLTFLTNLQTIMGGESSKNTNKCMHNGIKNKITGIEFLPTSKLISMALTFL